MVAKSADILSIDAQIDHLADRIHARALSAPMTPLQRSACVVTKQIPDRMPMFVLSVEYGAHYLGYRINKDFAWDPKKWAHAALAFIDRFDSDVCAPILDVYIIGPDAMGCEVIYHEDSFPEVMAGVKTPADLAKIENADYRHNGRMRVLVEACQICREKVGDIMAVSPVINAPFSWAANVRGIYDFLADLRRNPKFAHDLLERCTAGVNEGVRMFLEAGLKPVTLADATASTYLISPAQINEFAWTYNEKLVADLGAENVLPMYLADFATQAKYCTGMAGLLAGINNYVYCEAEKPLREEDLLEGKRVARQLGVAFQANLWGRWVQVHTPKEIDEEVKRVVDLVGPEWPFQIGMWSVPVPCPIENLDAFVRALKKYTTFAQA